MGVRRNPVTHEDGCLSPWANPVTGALGWQVRTSSRCLAVTVAAITGGKAHPHEKGQWQARITESRPYSNRDRCRFRSSMVPPRLTTGFRRPHSRICAMDDRCRSEMPRDSIPGTWNAVSTGRADHNPHGPHRTLPRSRIHPLLERPGRRNDCPAAYREVRRTAAQITWLIRTSSAVSTLSAAPTQPSTAVRSESRRARFSSWPGAGRGSSSPSGLSWSCSSDTRITSFEPRLGQEFDDRIFTV
jgi:hypothetical protein